MMIIISLIMEGLEWNDVHPCNSILKISDQLAVHHGPLGVPSQVGLHCHSSI